MTTTPETNASTGLLVVDVQNDFCEGGALGVLGGIETAQRIASLMREYRVVVATMDWHNALPDLNGGHFAAPGTEPDFTDSWPVHCVAGTWGAAMHPYVGEALLNRMEVGGPWKTVRVRKGQGKPDYSGFQGVDTDGYNLSRVLRRSGVDTIDVVGIASDYCVLQTAIAGLQQNFDTEVLWPYTAAVGGQPGLIEARDTFDQARAGASA